MATYIGGNAGMPIVLCTVQVLSAFSPSSILASAYWAFHRPSRERRRYYSLWSSRFPSSFGTSRHHVLFSTEPERSPSKLFSSASPYRLSRHGCCGSSTRSTLRCLSSCRQQLFVTVTDFVRVRRAMFWTCFLASQRRCRRHFSLLLRQRQPTTAKTLRRHGNKNTT